MSVFWPYSSILRSILSKLGKIERDWSILPKISQIFE
jgi:hypothetical protein